MYLNTEKIDNNNLNIISNNIIINNMELSDTDSNNKIKLRLFPYLKNKQNISYLKIDPDSINYISKREYAKKISEIIRFHLQKLKINSRNAIITDATAGIGGNTISFATYFKKINSIEIDKTRSEFLSNNISVYQLDNVQIYHGDCLNILPGIATHHAIFIDPPWGGKNYKSHQNLRLQLSGLSLEIFCNQLLNKSIMKSVPEILVLKLPKNYDILYFYSNLIEKTIFYYDLNKMIILVVMRTNS